MLSERQKTKPKNRLDSEALQSRLSEVQGIFSRPGPGPPSLVQSSAGPGPGPHWTRSGPGPDSDLVLDSNIFHFFLNIRTKDKLAL